MAKRSTRKTTRRSSKPAAADTGFGEFEFLKRLTETPGIPGREERVRELILAETGDFWDEIEVDAMGSLICLKKAAKRPRSGDPPSVMVACHMDEIGFYVRHIDDAGRLWLQNAGGFDTRNLFARKVRVQGKRDLIGAMNPGGKPIHLSTPEERNKIPTVQEFYVDLFLDKKDVDNLVEVGDPVTLIQQTDRIGDAIVGKCMDNRVAVWVGINAAKKAAATSKYDVYFVACVQEEVGLRGATTAAYGIDPDIGVAIDTTLCCDSPGVSKQDAVTEFGKGVAIKVIDGASISDRGLFEQFIEIARAKKITHQREVLPRGGTDAGAVQRARAGRKTITLSIPTRNIHTITEAIHMDDARAAVNLLAAWFAK